MSIINVEIYSIVILVVLLANYIAKFYKKFNTASLIWMALSISTLLISISNIFFTISNIYIIRLISITLYLLSTITSSLFVYIYIKYVHIDSKINIKKESILVLCSILICVSISILYIFFSSAGYTMHSFDRKVFNKLLALAIIPNIVICISYIYRSLKNKTKLNYKVIVTLLITVVGLILDAKNSTLFFVSSTFTITALIFYINKHEQLLNTDPLTGLSNKRGLEDFISNMHKGLIVSVFNIDIDSFKKINDKYGHLNGDLVLQHVAEILRNSSRKQDLVIRNGGDEFLIIAEMEKEQDAKKIINRINYNLKSYNKNSKIKVSLSIGWGLYECNTNSSPLDFAEFLKKIDSDMYESKSKNRRNSKNQF